jgi:hypothetical protein
VETTADPKGENGRSRGNPTCLPGQPWRVSGLGRGVYFKSVWSLGGFSFPCENLTTRGLPLSALAAHGSEACLLT